MKYTHFLILLLALSLSAMACSVFVGGPDYPDQRIPISAEAVQSLRDQLTQAVASGAQTGAITLQITQEQLTSYIAFKLAEQENPILEDPQVYLQNGQMQIYGTAKRGFMVANVLISLNVMIDDLGQPKIEIETVDFGPFPAPDSLRQAITALVAEAFTGSLGPIATGFRLETIDISNGLMTVTGRVK